MEADDSLIEAVLTSGEDEVLLATREGMSIRFSEGDVRPMGRAAYGVKGIELEGGDEVVGMEVVREPGLLLWIIALLFLVYFAIDPVERLLGVK